MNTKANVHLLATNKSLYHLSGNKIIDSIELIGKSYLYKSIPVQLYITIPQSDLEISKIKEGDWCVVNWGTDIKGKKLFEVSKCTKIGKGGIHYFDSISMCFGKHELNAEKIIATTNTHLTEYTNGIGEHNVDDILLASIPQQFIEYYISEYNKGNIIKEVEVELEADWDDLHKGWLGDTIRLKLNQQNEISVVMDKSDRESDNHNGMFALPKQPQVDFEMLKETVDTFLSDSPLLSNYKQNMKLFFHLLSTKPTFATKAFKELNKLNK